MMKTINQYERKQDLFKSVCEQPQTETIQCLLLRKEVLDGLIRALRTTINPPKVQAVTTAETVSESLNSFPSKTLAADLQEQGQLQLRTRSGPLETSFVVTDEQVVSAVPVPQGFLGVRMEQSAVTSSVQNWFNEQWEISSAASIDAPALSRLNATVADHGSEAMAEKLDALVDAAVDMSSDGLVTDGTVLSLLAAAATSGLQQDVWRAAEAVGLASKSKVTRKKQALQDSGVIKTEKAPIDIGRPRIRLHLADEAPETPTDQLTWVDNQLTALTPAHA